MAVEKIITVFSVAASFFVVVRRGIRQLCERDKEHTEKKPEKYICSPLQLFLPFRVIRAVRKEAHKQDARAPAARFIRHTSLWYSLCRWRGGKWRQRVERFLCMSKLYILCAAQVLCSAYII